MSGRSSPLGKRQVGRAQLTSPNENCSRCLQCRCGLLLLGSAWRPAAEMSAKTLQRTEAAPRAARCTGVSRTDQALHSVQFLLVDQSQSKRQPMSLCHKLCSGVVSAVQTIFLSAAGSRQRFCVLVYRLNHYGTKTLRFIFVFHKIVNLTKKP